MTRVVIPRLSTRWRRPHRRGSSSPFQPADSIQPSLKFLQPPQELTSHRSKWTENAAAGKMAPEPAPLKGENFSHCPTPSRPSTLLRQSPESGSGGCVVCRRFPLVWSRFSALLRLAGSSSRRGTFKLISML